MKFRNPSNGYVEESSCPWLWCLLFGAFYFMAKGIWFHAILGIALALMTLGMARNRLQLQPKRIKFGSFQRLRAHHRRRIPPGTRHRCERTAAPSTHRVLGNSFPCS